jgi:anti-sigma B factor antagonist
MAITYEDVGESLRRIALYGRLDGPGTEEVSAELEALATTGSRRIVVDLTQISFLASVGIRAVLGSAKALQRNGGRMVLLVGTNPFVTRTLEATGIDALIPMFADAAEAEKAALA